MAENVGDSNNAVATFDQPFQAGDNVGWTTDNSAIATTPTTDVNIKPGDTRSIIPVTAKAPGSCNVTVTFNNADGKSVSRSGLLTVNPAPPPDVTTVVSLVLP